ncbi:hypothetical protein [Paludisphaera sp.]|uniref:hypothetical protein n=1 Tax=Paludisphaera sp. TaxID=2017432 RepID=UPI00301D92E4
MPNKPSFVLLSRDKAQELKRLCPADESEPWYRVIPQEQIPSVFPASFRSKLDHAVIMGSGDANGMTYLVVNAQRIDEKASAIDQEPFGMVFDNGVASESGVFVHHGDWAGRTESGVPPAFWDHVSASGIGNFYPPPSLPPNASGSLQDLEMTSNMHAFNQTLKKLLG